jgi:hypothetical protein
MYPALRKDADQRGKREPDKRRGGRRGHLPLLQARRQQGHRQTQVRITLDSNRDTCAPAAELRTTRTR